MDIMSHIIKITLIGDGACGKSSYFDRITHYSSINYTFNKVYVATNDFNVMKVPLKTSIGDVELHLWDTAGQEKFGDLRDTYLFGSNAVIIMYDVTNRRSIDSLSKWLHTVSSICGNVPVLVLGNKIDLIDTKNSIEHVKIRDSRLRSMFYGKHIHNMLTSTKENTIVVDTSYIFGFYTTTTVNNNGLMKPIEWLLSCINNKNVNIVQRLPQIPKIKILKKVGIPANDDC